MNPVIYTLFFYKNQYILAEPGVVIFVQILFVKVSCPWLLFVRIKTEGLFVFTECYSNALSAHWNYDQKSSVASKSDKESCNA